MDTNKLITIGCVGMTHLGLVHAAAFAEKGFNIVCYDEKIELINQLQATKLPVTEPQLDDLVASNISRLSFTADVAQLTNCALVFIAYDVPTDDEGNSSLEVIHELLNKVSQALSPSAALVILSQVPPGFTRQCGIPPARLFYQVETLVFGRAVERALYPERYIVGTALPKAALPKAYAQLLESFTCPILKMSYESAELAKISINLFLVASVTTTNTLAEICENIGADWEDIAPTLRLDRRIGQHAYLTPGLGIAGGNLERDLNTIIKLGKRHDTDTGTVQAWLKNSKYRRDWVLRCLHKHVLNSVPSPTICVLGLAYKPNTHSVKNSPSIALINQLQAYQVNTHDPIVQEQHFSHVHHYTDMFEAIKGADVLILMLACEEYKHLSMKELLTHMRGHTIIDPHRILTRNQEEAIGQEINYFCLGQGGFPSIESKKSELSYA